MALIDIDSVLFTGQTFIGRKRISYNSGDAQSPISGPRLRERVAAIMKTAALANGVSGSRIDSRSLRQGGATALYTHGVPLDAIHRWGGMEILDIPSLPSARCYISQ